MANDKKKRFELRSSPKGTLVFPRLVTPDTKFKVEGQFSTKLRLEGPEAVAFRTMIDTEHKNAFAEEKAKLMEGAGQAKARAKQLTLGKPPYDPEVDEDGNETGALIFKFSRNASGVSKRTGKKWTATIRLFDAAGNPVSGIEPFGGTVARVGFYFQAYLVPASNQAGVSLKLDAVKIIDLVQRGERSADDYGFGEEEEGFSASDVAAPAAPPTESEPEGEGETAPTSEPEGDDF